MKLQLQKCVLTYISNKVKNEFILNIWLMGWGQEEFPGGLQNQAQGTGTLSGQTRSLLGELFQKVVFPSDASDCLAERRKPRMLRSTCNTRALGLLMLQESAQCLSAAYISRP